jgi:hypothetical protein
MNVRERIAELTGELEELGQRHPNALLLQFAGVHTQIAS